MTRKNFTYRLAAFAATAFFCFILWIIYLANTGGSSPFFDFVRSLPYGDKLGHFGLFGSLTFIVIIATRFKSFSIGPLSIYYGLAAVWLFIVIEEISQAFIATRTFDLVDLSADALGVMTATGLCYVLNTFLLKEK